MATDCDYVFADLLPDQGTVAVKVVEDEKGPKRTRFIKHVVDDGKLGREGKERAQNSMSKNAIRMRERRKDPEHRKKENERRKLQRRQQKKKKEEGKKSGMRKIPPLSILSETTSQIEEKTGQKTLDYIVRREVEFIEATTFAHQKLEEENKENQPTAILYRAKNGNVRRARHSRS